MRYKLISEAVFISRPNRFIAEVIIDGRMQRVHVRNTGRCRELLKEGVRVFLEDHGTEEKGRKTRYSLVAVEKAMTDGSDEGRLVNIDSIAPNRVAGEALAAGKIDLIGLSFPLSKIKAETVYGESRFDFYVEDKNGKKAFIEVKGVTLEQKEAARFPDAPTERGVKHIRELSKAAEEGYTAYILFVIQMKGVAYFSPNDDTHPAFGDALREANRRGVVILAYDCDVTCDSLSLGRPVPVRL
jgi:sugar fermentation stimulation protein A